MTSRAASLQTGTEDPMSWIYVAALSGALLAAPARAQSDQPTVGASPPAAASPAQGEQQFKQITAEFDTAMKDFSGEYRKATTDEERQKILDAKYPKPDEYAKRLMPLAQSNPNTPLARDVYVWMVAHNVQGTPGSEALTQLAANFPTDPAVAQQIIPRLQWSDSPQAEALLR